MNLTRWLAQFLSKVGPDWRTLVSAALVVLAFPPWDFTPLIFIGPAFWLLALRRSSSLSSSLLQALWMSFFMTLGGFSWVAYVLRQFGGLPWPIAILGLLLFGLICQPQFYAFAALEFLTRRWRLSKSLPSSKLLSRTLLSWTILASLAYTGIDWLLPKLFADTLGHAFYRSPWLRQMADLGGVSLLTFLVYLFNHSLADLIERITQRVEPSYWPALRAAAPTLALALSLWGIGTLYGRYRFNQITDLIAHTSEHLQIGVIQAQIGDFEKVSAERGLRGAREHVMRSLLGLSEEALQLTPKPHAIIWPETAYPSTFRNPAVPDELAMDQQVEQFVRTHQVPLYFGGYDEGKNHEIYNAIFFLAPKPFRELGLPIEGDLQTYHKRHLLMFGEYLPGSSLFPSLRRYFPQVANFGRGTGAELIHLPLAHQRMGFVLATPAICYEVLFPSYIRESVRRGSRLIVNVTNDSWFGPFGEPELHLALASFRSIESRIPTLRSTNTGISAVILPNGEIAQQTPVNHATILNSKLPLVKPQKTLFLYLGDWFGPVAGLIATFLLMNEAARRRRIG